MPKHKDYLPFHSLGLSSLYGRYCSANSTGREAAKTKSNESKNSVVFFLFILVPGAIPLSYIIITYVIIDVNFKGSSEPMQEE
jgi:hypothetical protein